MSSLPSFRMTEQAYLARERAAEYKSEYFNGEAYAMSGGSPDHAGIAMSLGTALSNRLRGRKPCRVFSSDLKVHIPATGSYAYPDVTVICSKPLLHPTDNHTVTNPTVLFEVLSPTTQTFDKTGKFSHYRRIDSLQAFVVVAWDTPRVEVYSRADAGRWILTEARGLDGVIRVESLDCELPLSEIYEAVEFPHA